MAPARKDARRYNERMKRLPGLVPFLCIAFFAWLYWSMARVAGVPWEDTYLGYRALKFFRDPLHPPLIWTYKHGPGDFYMTMPFVAILGHTAAALRWRNAVFAALALWSTHALGLRLYRDRAAAALAAALLAACPSLVVLSTTGAFAGIGELALGVTGLLFLARYADERRPASAVLGAACLGWALSGRTTMAAYLIGLGAYAALFRADIRALLPPDPAARRRLAAASLAAFAFFLLPVAAALLLQRDVAAQWVAHVRTQESGRSNLRYWDNLLERLDHAELLFKGRVHLGVFVENRKSLGVPGQRALEAALAAGAIGLAWAARRRRLPRRWLLPWIVGGVYLLLSPFSPSSLKSMHLFPALPLFFLAACAIVPLTAGTRLRAWVVAALALLTLVRAAAAVRTFREVDAELARRDSQEIDVSRALTDLALWANERRPASLVFLARGCEGTAEYYSGGAVVGRELRLDRPGAAPAPADALEDPRAYFVSEPGSPGAETAFAAFSAAAARAGRAADPAGRIDRPDGSPAFVLYRAVRR